MPADAWRAVCGARGYMEALLAELQCRRSEQQARAKAVERAVYCRPQSALGETFGSATGQVALVLAELDNAARRRGPTAGDSRYCCKRSSPSVAGVPRLAVAAHLLAACPLAHAEVVDQLVTLHCVALVEDVFVDRPRRTDAAFLGHFGRACLASSYSCREAAWAVGKDKAEGEQGKRGAGMDDLLRIGTESFDRSG